MTKLTFPRNEIMARLPDIIKVGTVILVGPPGTGKSWMARNLAAELSVGFFQFACNPDGLASDVIGSMLPKEDGTGQWGFVPAAYAHAAGHGPRYGFDTKGGILCVDDLQDSSNGILAALNIAADGHHTQWLDPRGEQLRPCPEYGCIMTSNGDVDSLPPSVRDRISAVIPVMEPSTPMLEALHPDVRELCEADYDNNYNPIASYRQWRSVSDFWPILGLAQACLVALGTPEKAAKMLHGMASMDCRDAIDAVKELGGLK